MAPPSVSRIAEQIWLAMRACPGLKQLWGNMSTSTQSSLATGLDPTNVVLCDGAQFLKFLMCELEYLLFPHARWPDFAAFFVVQSREMARTLGRCANLAQREGYELGAGS